MAEQDPKNGSTDSSSSEDPIKQLKSEFSRKQDNVLAQIQAQNEKMEQIMQAMIAQQQALKVNVSSTNQEPEIDPYTNPKGFQAQVAAKAAQSALDAVTKMSQRQAEVSGQVNEVVNKLAIDYPELNDRTSELYIRAQEIQNTMPKDERFSPTGIRAAVREAAADLGILTVSKRNSVAKSNGEDFTVGGGKNSSSSSSTPKKDTGTKLDERILATAELMGVKVDDPEVLKRLTKHAERKVWNRYK